MFAANGVVAKAYADATKAEDIAHDFFADALQHVQQPDVKALFAELREEEQEHQTLVKEVMARLPPETSTIQADDFADDPVAH